MTNASLGGHHLNTGLAIQILAWELRKKQSEYLTSVIEENSFVKAHAKTFFYE